MTRNRLLASIVVAALVAGGIAIWGGPGVDQIRSVEALRTWVVTTEPAPQIPVVFDMTAIAEEEAIIGEVVSEVADSMATSTTTTSLPPSTTTIPATTAPPETSAESESPATTSPPATSPPTTAAPGGFSSSAENDFAGRINNFRDGDGLSGLSRHGSLDSYARSWAKTLAERGELSHSNIGSLLGSWSSVGENVGMGGSVSGIFDALASSSGHRGNMLGDDYTHVGIGVFQDADGTLWTAHVFAG